MVVKLSYIVLPEYGVPVGGVLTVPNTVLAWFTPRATQIGNGEALAPFLCLMSEPELLRGTSVVWFVDNLGVLSTLCNGSSSVPDFDCVIHAVLLRLPA